MDEIIQGFLADLKVGARQSHRNMTLYCLLAEQDSGVDFLTLDEALVSGVLTVTEVNEAGSVPQLTVVNKSERKVLVLDGEELSGAKQNRVLNVTVLVAPRSETMIPVSCVEQGRWSYRGKEFHSESRAMSARMKQRKTESVTMRLNIDESYGADQGFVWNEIADKYARMGTPLSSTQAMADLFESHSGQAEEYLQAFRPVDHQVGIVVFIDGTVAGMEVLSEFHGFRQVHKKLLNSYVMDALKTVLTTAETVRKASRSTARRILEVSGAASSQKRKSVALGLDIRLESGEVLGAGLEFEGHVLQMGVFAKFREGGRYSAHRTKQRSISLISLRSGWRSE